MQGKKSWKYRQKVFGGYRCFRVLKSNKLVGVGWNASGQLGDWWGGKDRNEFVEIELPDGAEIVDFNGRCSSNTTVVLTTFGLVGTGLGIHGEFGDATVKNRMKLSLLEFYKDVKVLKYFAEGWGLWVFLENGAIMRSGSNIFGQMGNGTRSAHIFVPEKLNLNFLGQQSEKLVHLTAWHQTALLSDEGKVYVCGANGEGQLGLGRTGITSASFAMCTFFFGKFVTNVVSGSAFLIFVTKKFHVYSCGRNANGELGIGGGWKRKSTPVRIAAFGNLIVDKICAGAKHSVVLTKGSEIYSFGENFNWQCGVESNRCNIFVPTLVKTRFKPVDIEVASVSSLIIDNDGYLHTCGENAKGQCGLGNFGTFVSPVKKLMRCSFKIDLVRTFIVDEALARNLCSNVSYRNIIIQCEVKKLDKSQI